MFLLYLLLLGASTTLCSSQSSSKNVGKFEEVFAWKQLTYEIDGYHLTQDRAEPIGVDQKNSDQSTDDSNRYFIQYNNVPMGVERVGDRLFVTVPRRKYGIPSTLNYVDLKRHANNRSPPLTPYPNVLASKSFVSVYRTKADSCGRLWMVDTGMMDLPNNRTQLQPPAIVIFDLNTDTQILRYPFKESDLLDTTESSFVSITIDVDENDCDGAYAYVADLKTPALIVFSLRERNSWRFTNNYFSFDPLAGNLNIGGRSSQWDDGIFSITLSNRQKDGCRTAYFHPLISYREFAVSTCVLKNETASSDSNVYTKFQVVAYRGENSQSTIHAFHSATQVVFFANPQLSAISCWRSGTGIEATKFPLYSQILAQDTKKLIYSSDLHVTDDDVWVMSNSFPIASQVDPNEYNFYVYKGNVQELIEGTRCSPQPSELPSTTKTPKSKFIKRV